MILYPCVLVKPRILQYYSVPPSDTLVTAKCVHMHVWTHKFTGSCVCLNNHIKAREAPVDDPGGPINASVSTCALLHLVGQNPFMWSEQCFGEVCSLLPEEFGLSLVP